MNDKKSLLNPDAAPYMPLLKIFSGRSFEGETKASNTISSGHGDDKDTDDTAGFQLPRTTSDEYNIWDAEKVHVSDTSSSKMTPQTGVSEKEITVDESQIVMDDPNLLADTLSSIFPCISTDFLAEVLKLNHGDISDTIDMLEQLEFKDGGCEEFAEASGINNNLDPKGNSSGRSDST